ncbi:MAG: alpha-glucan family phosphorylase [bacterium]
MGKVKKKSPGTFLFEVSWEVCNQVGGIYTVLSTKVAEAKKLYGEDYICIGPLLAETMAFVDTSDDNFWHAYKDVLDEMGCEYRLGYWDIPEKPRVILLSYEDFYDADKVLYTYWEHYHLDTFDAGYDVVHPLLFSTRVAQFIHQFVLKQFVSREVIAHFHEWMTGAGILYLNTLSSFVSTVFTTHATVLGRAYAGHSGRLDFASFSSLQKAQELGVLLKHRVELLSALQSDCFTCVSDLVAEECSVVLGQKPHVVVKNGLNLTSFRNARLSQRKQDKMKQLLLKKASDLFAKPFLKKTQLWISAGRFECHNKGFDLLVDALDALNTYVKKIDGADVLLVLTPAVLSKGLTSNVKDYLSGETLLEENTSLGVCVTHEFLPIEEDGLLQKLLASRFANDIDRKVFVLYSPQLLQGNDHFYGCSYYQLLGLSDLSIFPSLYEPWGYTPQESLALGVPTIASDTSGFAQWAKNFEDDIALGIVTRSLNCYQTSLTSLAQQLQHFYHLLASSKRAVLEKATYLLAEASDWSLFYEAYQDCYRNAVKHAELRRSCAQAMESVVKKDSAVQTSEETVLKSGKRLQRQLEKWTSNWWWSYDPRLGDFFALLQPKLWKGCSENPLEFIKQVDVDGVQYKLKSLLMQHHLQSLDEAYSQQCDLNLEYVPEGMDPKCPIAYFSMEFGLHSLLPIYSGGLGVLAGDILKSASDVYMPMVGVGLLYRSGYFNQSIDGKGLQRVQGQYLTTEDLLKLNLKPLFSDKELLSLSFFDKTIYLQCWQLKVGRSVLYLLDSDVSKNSVEDRSLTHSLYPADRLLRLKQEIILGVAGVRLLGRLGIDPQLYHLNEGHSAFLILERLRVLRKENVSLLSAIDQVRMNTCFTTHTSVPAGLECFDPGLVERALSSFWPAMGISFSDCLAWATDPKKDGFSMTVLALRFSGAYNGVSTLHVQLANQLWKRLACVQHKPIQAVTNAVHPLTWVGSDIRSFYGGLLDQTYQVPHLLTNTPLGDIWRAHSRQKQRFLSVVSSRVKDEYSRRGTSFSQLDALVTSFKLHPDWLTVGFARRFATYKQADLLLDNPLWLQRLVSKGLRFVFAGKAHPADKAGMAILQKLYQFSLLEEFQGHIFVLENYDMELASLMVQGVDVWLNTPVFGNEASGTSGMKASLNGVLNVSVADGWWHEGFDSDVGWCIQVEKEYHSDALLKRDYAIRLYTLLEKDILPMFYQRAKSEVFSQAWVSKMKQAMARHIMQFSGQRMMKDYYQHIYKPMLLGCVSEMSAVIRES